MEILLLSVRARSNQLEADINAPHKSGKTTRAGRAKKNGGRCWEDHGGYGGGLSVS